MTVVQNNILSRFSFDTKVPLSNDLGGIGVRKSLRPERIKESVFVSTALVESSRISFWTSKQRARNTDLVRPPETLLPPARYQSHIYPAGKVWTKAIENLSKTGFSKSLHRLEFYRRFSFDGTIKKGVFTKNHGSTTRRVACLWSLTLLI